MFVLTRRIFRSFSKKTPKGKIILFGSGKVAFPSAKRLSETYDNI